MTAPELEYKAASAIGPDTTPIVQPEGIVETLIAVTGVKDDVNDVIVPGAFARTLAERKPKVCLGHDWNRPIGKTLAIKELLPGDSELPTTTAQGAPWPAEAGAVFARAQFNLNEPDGLRAYRALDFYGPEESSFSIGYKVVPAKTRKAGGVRYIGDLDLHEYSPVLHPANRLASLQMIKNGKPDALEDKAAGGERILALIKAETAHDDTARADALQGLAEEGVTPEQLTQDLQNSSDWPSDLSDNDRGQLIDDAVTEYGIRNRRAGRRQPASSPEPAPDDKTPAAPPKASGPPDKTPPAADTTGPPDKTPPADAGPPDKTPPEPPDKTPPAAEGVGPPDKTPPASQNQAAPSDTPTEAGARALVDQNGLTPWDAPALVDQFGAGSFLAVAAGSVPVAVWLADEGAFFTDISSARMRIEPAEFPAFTQARVAAGQAGGEPGAPEALLTTLRGGQTPPASEQNPPPGEQVSTREVDAATADANEALGLTADANGALQVDTDVADRQDRVKTLLDQGKVDLASEDDTTLTDQRHDLVNEAHLQAAIVQQGENGAAPASAARGIKRSGGDATPDTTGDGNQRAALELDYTSIVALLADYDAELRRRKLDPAAYGGPAPAPAGADQHAAAA